MSHFTDRFYYCVAFEALTAVDMKGTTFRDDAMLSVESQPTFRRNISPPSSVSKNKTRKMPVLLGLPHTFTYLIPVILRP
jgi:hypothetical protein